MILCLLAVLATASFCLKTVKTSVSIFKVIKLSGAETDGLSFNVLFRRVTLSPENSLWPVGLHYAFRTIGF